jgi:protein-disulfide isomerase
MNIHFIVKSFSDQQKIMMIKQKLNMFKVDNDVLKAKCAKQFKYTDAKEISTLFFGNKKSIYQITILTNPKCSHCAKLHKEIEPLLHNRHINLGIRFVLISFGPEYDYACKLFIAAKQQLKDDEVIRVISSWFEAPQRHDESFIKSFGLNIDDDNVLEEYELHKKWVNENHLNSTPTVLINGYMIPDPYEIKDINNMEEL